MPVPQQSAPSRARPGTDTIATLDEDEANANIARINVRLRFEVAQTDYLLTLASICVDELPENPPLDAASLVRLFAVAEVRLNPANTQQDLPPPDFHKLCGMIEALKAARRRDARVL